VNPAFKALLLRIKLVREVQAGRALLAKREDGLHEVFIDYPLRPIPRFGHGKPAHPRLLDLLNRNRSVYEQTLSDIVPFAPDLQRIPVRAPGDSRTPYWMNRFLQGVDPASLYALVCRANPRTYVEIGSGNSTKFARRAIQDHRLRTHVVSIDPHPRAEIDGLCDEVRREGLEKTDLAIFERLEAGDIVFMDGSHRVFMNSDVSVFFLEVLPNLRPGVLVYIDDIWLPFDYPPEWVLRYYSEQYMLAVLLLAEARRYEVILPSTLVGQDAELMAILDPVWKSGPLAEAAGPGNGFWLRIR
jgi:hypothetical protein